MSFTLDRAIRIQEVYDFDCKLCVNQVKAFLGTTAQTQGPQGTVSTVVLEDEKRILQALKEIKDLLSQHAPQLLAVFKMKSLLTLIYENFSEMRAGSYDMPLQLQFDFRFSRALKDHLKQICRTEFCHYTNSKSHYARVQSGLRYSELPKMSPPSSAQLTKSQVQQMRDWRIKPGQSVAQKMVRNMSTKDNPGSLQVSHLISVRLERSLEKRQKQQLPQEGRGDQRRGQVILSSRLVTLSILPQMLHLAK